MTWRNVKLTLLREVRDQLRDRRTLFMVLVLPLLLYPAMGIGMMEMTLMFREQPRTVVILGANHLPRPELVDGTQFASSYFRLPDDAKKLRVITDRDGANHADDDSLLLTEAERIRKLVERRHQLIEEFGLTEATPEEIEQHAKLSKINGKLSKLFSQSSMQILIIVPEGLREAVERVNQQLADHQLNASEPIDYERPIVVRNSADEKSLIAFNFVHQVMDSWEKAILNRRLREAALPETLSRPVNPAPVDLAEKSQVSANLWSKLVPALLVIFALTGAFYPAVDLAAGEKERGTMETLLICPATRTEIVLGKFATVMLFSMSTAILNLLSMGITGKYVASLGGVGAMRSMGEITWPAPQAMAWIVLLLVPLAALFSALCLALATFARSSKEGQYYLTPLLMVTMGLTMFCIFPTVELNLQYSVLPVVGIALVLKALLLSPLNAAAVDPICAGVVLVSSVIYGLLALWWAIEQFQREDVLFREAERFDLRLWIQHLLRDKEATPSFTEAGFCFVLIMLLQFLAIRPMQAAIPLQEGTRPGGLLQLMMVQQLVIIACPALFMAIMLTTNVATTLRLRLPKWRHVLLGIGLAVLMHPGVVEFGILAQRYFFTDPIPSEAAEVLSIMGDPSQPIWLLLVAFAVFPAICEELAFRGFILSGFRRSGRKGLAIILASVTFGVMHLIPQQVVNATLLGLVLGLVTIHSGSLVPAILFHFVNNALAVIRERVPLEWAESGVIRFDEAGLRFHWLVTLLGLAAAGVLLWRLWNPIRKEGAAGTPPMPPVNVPKSATWIPPQAQ